jgi:hypothetical protein
VVFETDQRVGREIDDIGVDHDISDETALAGIGGDVDEADARESFALGGHVVVAKELIATAHCQHDGAIRDRALERRLLVLDEVFVDQRLLAVLAAAEEKHVDLVHVPGGATPELDEAGFEVAPLGALEQGEDVAAVAVDVHEVGIEPTDREQFLVVGHSWFYVSQYGFAQPRLTSSALRSSMAV